MLRRLLVGREMPALITVLVTRRKKGGYDVLLITESGPVTPKQPPPATTLTEARTLVDALISDFYMQDDLFAELLLSQEIGVGYALYPWDGREKAKKDAAQAMGTDYLMFDVEEVPEGFFAAERTIGIEVDAPDLDDLAAAAANAVLSRWAAALEGRPIPGMLNWQRTFRASGFTPHRREGGPDAGA